MNIGEIAVSCKNSLIWQKGTNTLYANCKKTGG